MRTKTRPEHIAEIPHCVYEKNVSRYGVSIDDIPGTYPVGLDTITYSTAPEIYPGHYPWQECSHLKDMGGNPVSAHVSMAYHWPGTGWSNEKSFILLDDASLPAAPTGSWDRTCLNGISDQLDLNSRENVLLYSGVIQAIPLLGSVFKLNAICRKIARNTSKSFRRKPFTTVIKSLISADFIDRFVISPTLDDARRFQDACDYTLRVMQTARDRNSHRFALNSAVKTTISDTESFRRFEHGGVYTARVDYRTQQTIESKAFMLLEARYNMTAVSPLKVWAQRVGLTRPLDSVWDLVPFSFVADYFARGGDFISHLSDKMSEVEGLKAKVATVYDLWGTLTARTVRRSTAARLERHQVLPYRAEWDVEPNIVHDGSYRHSTRFLRFRVAQDPFSLLASLDREENWGSLNLSLRSTQKRTLAELFIQAKLKP